MIIEESIVIRSGMEKVWKTFSDITCWIDWNTVMKDVKANKNVLSGQAELRCRFYPFLFPIEMKITVEEAIPYDRIVWSAEKPGLFSRHEFFFRKRKEGVTVTSRETFTGFIVKAAGVLLPVRKMKALTKTFLNDLKNASER